MIDNTVGSFLGHIQVQDTTYFDEPNLNNSMVLTDSLLQQLHEIDEIHTIVPRIDSYALAGGQDKTRAVMVVGTDPESEKELSRPQEKLITGSYFESGTDRAVLISEGLADYLDLAVGDSLVLLGSGFRGVTAADLLPVKGIVKFGIPDMNRGLVYMPLQTAHEFFGAYDRVTALAILAERASQAETIAMSINETATGSYRAYDWKQLMPELIQAIQADRGSSYIILLVLYMVVGFGILGTVLMMTNERSYEFGVLLSIGTSRLRISLMLVLETLFITFSGTIAGIVLSVPVIRYFHVNPLEFSGQAADAILEYGMEPFIRFSTDPGILFIQAGIVAVISLLIGIYPVIHTFGLNPVEAMRK
jgi:ABC-type lipoprotein release transport system permease subunit